MTDKQLIKEEIEKEMHVLDLTNDFDNGRFSELNHLKLFIDSLPEEPASEDKSEKELVEAYLAVFDRKYPILPTLKGKQKADFKNFLNKCQQEFGLKEFGIHPTQAKLFEKLTLLWATWGAKHLEGLGKSNQDESDKMSASDDLEEEIDTFFSDWLIDSDEHKYYVQIARHFAEWQKQKDQETIELAEEHAMLAGMEKMREEMMKDAVILHDKLVMCYSNGNPTGLSPYENWYENEEVISKFKDGDKLKIIIVKED